MKTRILFSILLVASLHAEGTVATRKERQQARLAQGVKSGELTPKEDARLEHKEVKLHREIRSDRKQNGGTLTAPEKRQVNRQQNHISKDIYKQKHDAQAAPK